MLSGQVFDEERRVVVRGDAVGGAEPRSRPAVQPTRRRAGDRQLPTLLPLAHRRRRRRGPCRRRRSADPAAAARGLSARDLRPDVRVLAARRRAEAVVPRDPHVPAAQEHGLLAARRRTRAHHLRVHLVRLVLLLPANSHRPTRRSVSSLL